MSTFICRSSQAAKIAEYLDSYYPHEFSAVGTKVFCTSDLKDDEWLNEIKEHARGYHRGIEDTLASPELAALRAENAELRENIEAALYAIEPNRGDLSTNQRQAIDNLRAILAKRTWSADEILKREG